LKKLKQVGVKVEKEEVVKVEKEEKDFKFVKQEKKKS
jgi:hypothetical protein